MPGWEVEQGRDVESLVRELLLLVSLLDQCELREARYHTLVHNAGRQLLAEYEKRWHLGQKIRRNCAAGVQPPGASLKAAKPRSLEVLLQVQRRKHLWPKTAGVSPGAQC